MVTHCNDDLRCAVNPRRVDPDARRGGRHAGRGPAARKPPHRNDGQDRYVEKELQGWPRLAPLPNASETPISDAAEMVVTEMNTPIGCWTLPR